MKIAIPLVAFSLVGEIVFAQGASDPMTNLRACSVLPRTERLECLEELSLNIAPLARSAPRGNDWIVSETTSPVDYTPIVTATTFSRGGADGSAMQLSIYCRGGRTELVVAGRAVSLGSGEYAISYRVNGDQPVHLAASSPSFGNGAAFTGDVVRLLQSLSEDSDIAVHLSNRTGAAQEGHFFLGGLKTVREKVAAACKWPHVMAKPRS